MLPRLATQAQSIRDEAKGATRAKEEANGSGDASQLISRERDELRQQLAHATAKLDQVKHADQTQTNQSVKVAAMKQEREELLQMQVG